MDHAVRPREPDYFADRPDRSTTDLLSALLRSVRLTGQGISDHGGVASSAYQQGDGALHLLEDGTARLDLQGGDTVDLEAGDLAMLPMGVGHRVVSTSPAARWITGRFEYDELPHNSLLTGLPALVVLRHAEVHRLEWFDVSRRLLLKERDTPTQGSSVMISRILDLLFVQVLRAWAAGPDVPAGWLRAAFDPDVSRALDAIHDHPDHAWTTRGLAAVATMSRSTFNERFSRSVGQPPMAYLARVRMDLARTLLRDGSASVREIGRQVGYGSEAAFSRAFAQANGLPPSRWRQTHSGR